MDLRAYSDKDYDFVKSLYLKALSEDTGKAVKSVMFQPRITKLLSLLLPAAGYMIFKGLTNFMLWSPQKSYAATLMSIGFVCLLIIASTYSMFSIGMKRSVKASFERDMADIPSSFDLKTIDDGHSYQPTSISNVWIATYNGEQAGFVTVRKSGVKSCEIRKLAVLQKYRRRGFGEMMVRQTIQWANDHDIETVFSVNIANSQIAACELFEKCNFIIAKQKRVVEGFGYLAYSLSLKK